MSAMPGMHHAMMMADMPHEQAMSHPAVSPAPQSTHTMPLDHAEACGYCVLLAHVPGLLFALALLISVILRRVRVLFPCLVLKRRHFFPGCTPKPARRRVGLLFLLSKITMRTALRSLLLSERKSMTTCTSRAAWLNLLRRLHFYIGLFIGPFIFVAALTGTLYVATPQLENWLYQDALHGSLNGDRQPLSAQLMVAEETTQGIFVYRRCARLLRPGRPRG